jgi:hypothetical protein
MLRPFIDEARQRHEQRPASPGVDLRTSEDGYRLEPPHSDLEAWLVQICDSFGTRSHSTYRVFLEQLAELCPLERDKDRNLIPSELHLNAALNIVSGVRPRNEMEAALAAEMVAIHFMMMKVSADTLRHGWTDTRTAGVAGKLARTFAMQCDALARLRGRVGKQVIKVRYERHDHRHVHVGEGGAKNGTQAQAPARPAACRSPEISPPLQGSDPARERMSGASCQG